MNLSKSFTISPFVLLCTTGLFAIFSSTISKSPVLPLFATHLGADPSGVGMVAAVSAFTGIVASIPAGMLSDRFGRKRMLLFSALVFSTAPFLYLLVTEIWQLAIVRFYHGLATAIFIPVAMALVSDFFHVERGEKMGWFSTSTLLGRFMAPIAGGSIIGLLVLNPRMSYEVVYIVCGIVGIVALIFTLRIQNPPSPPFIKGGNLKTPFLEKGDGGGFSDKKPQSWKETATAFRTVISHRGILIASAVEASILFAYGTFETFLPLYSVKVGLSAYEVGIFLSAQVITLALTKPMMGRFSDRHGRRPQIFAGAIIGAVCIGCFPLFKSFIPLLALSILFGLSFSIVTSATSAFIADLSRKETHGSAMGILGSIMDIGHTTGPLISGIVAAYFGFGTAFISVSAILASMALAFWWFPDP
ncbi:MAG: MFS transporter [Nitrospirae bacterium]|nr:MFS transporter [Nitrospirota bacterium]